MTHANLSAAYEAQQRAVREAYRRGLLKANEILHAASWTRDADAIRRLLATGEEPSK